MHLCEAIVLRCRSLAFKRCTGVWRPEADESPFQGDEEGVSPPRGQREARGVGPAGAGVLRCLSGAKTKDPRNSIGVRGSRRTAATYSPNWWVSTIGDGELNFSVRNGKRWFLTAIATAVYDLRERSRDCQPARPCAPIDTLRRKSLSRTYSLLQFHLRRIFP